MFCFFFVWGLVLWTDLRKCLSKWEELWNVNLLVAEFDYHDVTLCRWQDTKIQLLTVQRHLPVPSLQQCLGKWRKVWSKSLGSSSPRFCAERKKFALHSAKHFSLCVCVCVHMHMRACLHTYIHTWLGSAEVKHSNKTMVITNYCMMSLNIVDTSLHLIQSSTLALTLHACHKRIA